MTTAKPTPSLYAHVLRAIADGEIIEWEESSGVWIKRISDYALKEIANAKYPPKRYRVKPKVIIINGMEVPEPLREIPSPDTEVFWPSFGPNASDANTENYSADFYPVTLAKMLEAGLLHSTQEAASAHALALISFTKTTS